MEYIDFMHTPEGVKVYTTEAPFMSVIADSYEIGKHIIEKNLVWLEERIAAEREAEMNKALGEVITLPTAKKEEYVDTAPSEYNPMEDFHASQGC